MTTRLFLPILCLTLFFSLFRLGSVTLFDVDEAVFSQATKEMVETGNWMTPTYNGQNRYDKPILFYWLMAVSYKIFGINEFGARFPSAIASCLLIISLFFFTLRVQDEKTALYAALPAVLSLSFFVYSHAAVTDMALTLFITLSLCSFYLSVCGNEQYVGRDTIYSYGFYLFSALAFLTKGLIGMVFPFGIALIYMIVTEKWGGIRKVFRVKGLVFFLLIAAPWYIAQFSINGQEFFDQFVLKHHFKRYTGVISGHKGPLYYYIPVFIVSLFPWIAYLPAGIRNTVKEKERLLIFASLWVAFIFIFFSFSITKLPNYILPAIPGACLLIASGMKVQDRRWWQFSHFFMAGMALFTSVGLLIAKRYLMKFGVTDFEWIYILFALTVGIVLLSVYSALVKKSYLTVLSVLMGLFLSLVSIKALPLISTYLQGTLHTYSLYAKERLSSHESLFVYGINNPSIAFYSGHKVITLRGKDDLAAHPEIEGRAIVITKTKNIDMIKNMGFSVLAKDERYAILERE
jgi:4-amino-4-deoxy-L-arabinose transferase-like glycosyltransferase